MDDYSPIYEKNKSHVPKPPTSSRLPHHKAQDEGAQDLGHQDISHIEAICDDVGSQSHATHIFGTGKHDTKQASSGHTAKQLCKQVGQTLIPGQLATQDLRVAPARSTRNAEC